MRTNYTYDLPIISKEEDVLGMNRFSKEIADMIIDAKQKSDNCFIFGINGRWGTGKTSLMNLIKCELIKQNEKIYFFEFNPWNYKDEVAIISNFFNELKNIVFKDDEMLNMNLFEKIKFIFNSSKSKFYLYIYLQILEGIISDKTISSFKSVIEFLGNINSFNNSIILMVSAFISLIPSLIKNDWSERLGYDVLINKINEKLVIINKKVIIFIDDVDRLDKNELELFLKLINNISNLKNIICIIAYDEIRISNIIAEKYALSDKKEGSEFLRKLIHFPINIIDVKKDNYRKYFIKRIKELTGESITEMELDRISDYFDKYFIENFKDLRIMNRFISDIYFKIRLLEGEINIADFITVEYLRFFYPEEYNLLKSMEDKFQSLIGNIKSKNDRLGELLKLLFDSNKSNFNSVIERRIFLDFYRQRYFDYFVEENIISDRKLNNYISEYNIGKTYNLINYLSEKENTYINMLLILANLYRNDNKNFNALIYLLMFIEKNCKENNYDIKIFNIIKYVINEIFKNKKMLNFNKEVVQLIKRFSDSTYYLSYVYLIENILKTYINDISIHERIFFNKYFIFAYKNLINEKYYASFQIEDEIIELIELNIEDIKTDEEVELLINSLIQIDEKNELVLKAIFKLCDIYIDKITWENFQKILFYLIQRDENLSYEQIKKIIINFKILVSKINENIIIEDILNKLIQIKETKEYLVELCLIVLELHLSKLNWKTINKFINYIFKNKSIISLTNVERFYNIYKNILINSKEIVITKYYKSLLLKFIKKPYLIYFELLNIIANTYKSLINLENYKKYNELINEYKDIYNNINYENYLKAYEIINQYKDRQLAEKYIIQINDLFISYLSSHDYKKLIVLYKKYNEPYEKLPQMYVKEFKLTEEGEEYIEKILNILKSFPNHVGLLEIFIEKSLTYQFILNSLLRNIGIELVKIYDKQILKKVLDKYLILFENEKNEIGQKNIENFKEYLMYLDSEFVL
ncbi:P-loop NTPase fold protein [Caloramator sp. CAR-1]|uniref:KAP family P-loop NTPase fold protein n=1 Tax=Caloramator sp. CAR-1 TaxID=3062777 RepID=UPI0026E233EF|nr:P-loop NTPase fold protein [Caloramator sp. CAR-1]MDO6354360.1 P-loop NTPase fold protein [Caloramator sp. CAR-1]